MTDERNTPGAATDPVVSAVYRETATERTPAHLDRAVLAAATAARPRYRAFVSWTRPAAWAAVVMLSFALLLELTRPPLPDEAGRQDQAPPALEEQVADKAAVPGRRERDAAEARELAVRDEDMLQRAADMARVQQGPVGEPAAAAPEPARAVAEDRAAPASAAAEQPAFTFSEKSALRSAATLADPESGCDEDARGEPATWLACIDELEAAGRDELARDERERLRAAFPDFSAP